MERLERLAVAELAKETRTHKERLLNTSRVRKMVDGICERAAKLVGVNYAPECNSSVAGCPFSNSIVSPSQHRTYADEDRARVEEIASFAGEGNAFKCGSPRLTESCGLRSTTAVEYGFQLRRSQLNLHVAWRLLESLGFSFSRVASAARVSSDSLFVRLRSLRTDGVSSRPSPSTEPSTRGLTKFAPSTALTRTSSHRRAQRRMQR